MFILQPRIRSPQLRLWRTCPYATFGFSSLLFVVHGVVPFGREVQRLRMSLSWMSWVVLSNLVGALVYAGRVSNTSPCACSIPTDHIQIPERWAPGMFDTIGSSHRIFHIVVAIAAVIHYRGVVEVFHVTRSGPACL